MIREINAASALCALAVGSAFNVTLVWLIWRKSPAEMRVYSRILLQTCGADLLMLLATAMTQPIYTMDNGVGIVLLNGPFGWDLFGFLRENGYLFLWDNCFFFAFFGFTAQFVFRYLVLNRNAKISAKQYFLALFSIVGSVDLVLALLLYRSGNPRDGFCCANPVILDVLHDNGESVYLAQKAGDYYALAWLAVSVCISIAYATIFVCTYKMRRFVRHNLKVSGTNDGTDRIREINQQLTLNMIIQSLLPLLTLLPVWSTLALSLANVSLPTTNPAFLQFMMLIRLPVHWTPVLNPLVTMLTVRHYKAATCGLIRRVLGQEVSAAQTPSQQLANQTNSLHRARLASRPAAGRAPQGPQRAHVPGTIPSQSLPAVDA